LGRAINSKTVGSPTQAKIYGAPSIILGVFVNNNKIIFQIQWALLIGITLGHRKTDSINQMIPLTNTDFA
jgi:hypothetical protein